MKAAYAEESIFVGADKLDELAALYDEVDGVVAFVIEIGGHEERALFAVRVGQGGQPFAVVDDALQSGANTIHGVLKTLGERPE